MHALLLSSPACSPATIDHNLAHIDEYIKDDVRDTPLMLAPAKTLVRYEPLGVALIFGSWNYPYVVNLNPLS